MPCQAVLTEREIWWRQTGAPNGWLILKCVVFVAASPLWLAFVTIVFFGVLVIWAFDDVADLREHYMFKAFKRDFFNWRKQ